MYKPKYIQYTIESVLGVSRQTDRFVCVSFTAAFAPARSSDTFNGDSLRFHGTHNLNIDTMETNNINIDITAPVQKIYKYNLQKYNFTH